MRIRIDDPRLVDELVHHLRRSGCIVERCDVEAHRDRACVEVELPAAHDEEQARVEVGLYLKVFQATHLCVASVVV